MASYREALQQLNAAQKKAVETIDGPVLVIAGPGTGKTQLLTTRIAHILAVTDTLPQNILCLTFTDSAAQTMRERLSSMIGQAAYDVGISTYHAFGSELIRGFPEYFAEQADLQAADDLTIDRIFREIIAGLPYNNPLKYADMYLGDIKTLVSDAKRALLTPANLRAVAHENLAFIEQTSPVVQAAFSGLVRVDKKAVPRFQELAEKLPTPHSSAPWRSLAEQCQAALTEALGEAETSGKTTPLTAWKNAWLAKNETGEFILDGAKTNQKMLAAADVYDAYLHKLAKLGLFDYDDMILRAVRTLETNADLRYTLQERYQYLLLDEFQDTNGAQLRLVELLTDNPVNEGRPNVLAVGDDDQAIYAFQGANYSHMLQFAELYRDVTVVPLTENYRSHASILQSARGIAEQIEERLHHHFPAIEKTLIAAAKNMPPMAILEQREAESDAEQFAWVAKQIATLIDQGMPPSDIAVLAPGHKYLEPLMPFLQQYSVPVRYEKRENVLDDPSINELLRMTELVLALARGQHALASSLWAEVLSFAFWNLPTSLIWQLSWQANDDRESWTEELLANEQLKPIALFFIRLSMLAGSETLETMLDYLVGSAPLGLQEPGFDAYTSPYYQHYFGDLGSADPDAPATFWNLLTNLVVLRARLRDYQKDGDERLTLDDFATFVEAHRAANLKILNTSPYASSADAVQVMTAYKAKGMEFNAVFVLAVTDEAWGSKARTQTSRLSLPQNLQFIRYAGATNDERLRLFYVALTRAKFQLYLVSYKQNFSGKHMTQLKYLAGEEFEPTALPAKTNETIKLSTELAAYWQKRHESALTQADLKALIQTRISRLQLSPTHVNDFVDVANCGPQAFFMRTVLRFPSAPRAQVQYGNAMHETLEWIHGDAKRHGKVPSLTATVAYFEVALRQKRLRTHDTKLFLERGQTALAAYLTQRAHTINAANVVEHNFRDEGVLVGDVHLSGKIDKLIIDPEARTIVIVDYKTGSSHSRWTREVKLHKYRQQLYLYKMLVEGSHTYAGYQVTGGYLEFIEPDESGVIRELHLTFDDAETERLKQLAQAVWKRIVTINLPDVSAYSADLAGIEAFEADLISELFS